MFRSLLLALVFTASGSAFAASLPALRAEIASADAKAASTRASRMDLQKSLDQVARQIEALKASRPAGALFGSSELDQLLKRSQDLSSRMTEALQSESEADEALRGGQSKLLGELDGELSKVEAKWTAAPREERPGLFSQLKALRAERDTLRRALPSAAVPQVGAGTSDDPQELLERADALLDSEDKLRREELALEKRITELKGERDLERRMNEFLGEDALFDEHDRRLSITRPGRLSAAADSNPAPTATVDSKKIPGETPASAQPPFSLNGSPAATDGRASPASYDDVGVSKSSVTPTTPGLGHSSSADAVAPPRVGVNLTPTERRAGVAPYSDDESLEELAVRRDQLKKLADETHRQADEATAKAKLLK